MKVVSWNVNSVRLRLRAISRLAVTHRPDVFCLQETKVSREAFPYERFRRLGYRHQVVAGQKGYNGVAILSKLPLGDVGVRSWCRRDDCRHVHASLPGLEIENLYVPAGGEIPDPERNPKFAHKLRFYRELARWFRNEPLRLNPVLLVGDLNVAPLPDDVWSHEKLKRVVTHTPIEVRAMERLRASGQFLDAVRHFRPAPARVFTWWSYRAPDFRRVNKGRRLDHAWVSPALGSRLVSAGVLDQVRGWRLPSDHAPVWVEIDA
jgi:exodeoxyribonuclease-3